MVLNKTQETRTKRSLSFLGGLGGLMGSILNKNEEIELELKFRIISSSHKEEDQYIIYDFNSFFGDVGGFLGLLLGYSILSLYGDMAGLFDRFNLCSQLKKQGI